MSLSLDNIQPNSKFRPPHQQFLNPLLSLGSIVFRPPPLKNAGCAREQRHIDLNQCGPRLKALRAH